MEKKQRLGFILSTLGVVLVLFGTTMAFFNYTRTGVSNVVKVGRIAFNSNQTNTITLLDAFPIDSTDVNSSNHVGTSTITITGDTTYDDGVEYLLTVSNLTNTIGNKKIPIDVVVSGSNLGTEDEDYFDNRGSTETIYKILNSNTIRNNQKILAGYISKGQAGVNGTVTIKAYLDKEKIAISDTYSPLEPNYELNQNLDNTIINYCIERITQKYGEEQEYYNVDIGETYENYCNGTGTRWGRTFNESYNIGSFNASDVEYFIEKKVLVDTNPYIGDTTSDWVAGRTVLTTTEWNSLQSNGVSFQVKVEANEGVWVPIPTGEELVRKSILAKQVANENSCNPIWVDTEDDITYFSGTNECVDMNYVWYSGKLWRIVAIYPDGAMKLVTENNVTSIAYGSINVFYGENASNVYQWLNEDFYDTLYNSTSIIDTSKKWNATNSNASSTNAISQKLPETTLVSANVGLINSYEFYNSYRCIDSVTCAGTNGADSFLNIKLVWWLLNPYSIMDTLWNVGYYGVSSSRYDNSHGIRPSIIIKPEITFTGTGTVNDPYRIVGDKSQGQVNALINTRLSGEYVKLKAGNNEQDFRIVDIEDNSTKIVAMDYADNKALKPFSNSSNDTLWGSGTTTNSGTWYTYLNNTYYPNLVSTYGDIFTDATYYFGTTSGNYKLSICANATAETTKNCEKTTQSLPNSTNTNPVYIGLLRYGEMFATQQIRNNQRANLWLINRISQSSKSWVIYNDADADDQSPTSSNAVRPTLHLKSTVKILSGSGLENDPYVVGL